MIYTLIRDSTKINLILDLILNELENNPKSDLIKINRVCKKTIRIYFKINDNESINFTVYSPSQFYLNELEKERN